MSDWNSPPDEPAYSVPETVDYNKLTKSDDLDLDHGQGSGFDSEGELPASEYPEVGEDDGQPGNNSV